MKKRSINFFATLLLLVLSLLSAFHFSDAKRESSILESTNRSYIKKQEIFPEKDKYYSVYRVVDGDTIDVDINGAHVRLRLIGIDTPETVDPRRPVECFGKEASEKAKELLEGKLVRLETDSSQGLYDKYDRMLAYVYLSDKTFFNKEMISEGYAHEYTYRLPYRYQTEFKTEEKLAREQKRGLWADGVCEK